MNTTNLRKVGGSVMLPVSPSILKILHLQTGSKVNLAIEAGRLIIEPQKRHRYSLKELLDQCDASENMNAEDQEWFNAKPIGRELL